MSQDKTIETTSASSFNTFGGIFSFWYFFMDFILEEKCALLGMEIKPKPWQSRKLQH